MKSIKKLLVANRSEIAIRIFRSAHELGIRTVAMYSYEDRFALHRFKADEAYQVGTQGEPVRAYLDIDSVIRLCREHKIDAVHPGYGFMSENPDLARACEENGIIFVGPSVDCLERLGDKTAARAIAEQANVPVLSGSPKAISTADEGRKLAEKLGFPIILKAAKGGGGRGMRVVREAAEFDASFDSATRESQSAFGSPDIFVEKYIEQARHIEVQLMGDRHGDLVHLFERDCSVQRRHQKVVEIAPAPNLLPEVRDALCEAAIKIGKEVGYQNAGTVEFLVDKKSNQFFFIEVNPRIQVEHTVTEEVTGVDVVKTQILIAQGEKLSHPDIDLGDQSKVQTVGFALQCRVTTEDPANNFLPDYGRVSHYRSASGMGIRLDAGSAFSGAVVHPYYDSMLVKVSARGRQFLAAVKRMERALQEFRVRGVKTNIPFLIRLMSNKTFLAGDCTTRFIDETPDLFNFPIRRDRATKLLSYLGEIAVNGNELVKGRPVAVRRDPAPLPTYSVKGNPPVGMRQKYQELGAAKFGQWIREQKPLLYTDTTFRDAHQSLLATRVRTHDLVTIAEAYSRLCPQLFSLEMWGGATFDTSMRFLKEDPWRRLTDMREKVPNILFQMLLRASNAVGYTNYPDNVVTAFVEEAAAAGIDVFRVFDALNWAPNMQIAMEAVEKTGAICEASICYTGDISDPKRDKYSLKYYVDLAKQLEKMGAHILAIKDMAGLCKPYAAEKLVKTLKQEVGLPIHFHTHDTAGTQAGAILKASEVGLDIADAAMAPWSGGTSQPNLNTMVEALRNTDRDGDLDTDALDGIAEYWRAVREFYTPFEAIVLPANADLYRHEMPGGQYTNLFQQARALGLADQWADICRIYADVNQLFGDIVKVTPTSKAVGDMALFLVANNLTTADVLDPQRELAFPASVKDLIGGRMGQPPGGFPPEVQSRIMRDEPIMTDRPGAEFTPADFAAATASVKKMLGREPHRREVVSYLLYPKVYEDFTKHVKKYGDVSTLPTPVFFYGQQSGEEAAVDIEVGKTLIVKFLTVGEPHVDGTRVAFFELNGQPREVEVIDHSLESDVPKRIQADADDAKQVGAAMPGMVVMVAVEVGDKVAKGQKLLSLEAMKMESTIYSEVEGTVEQVLVKPGSQVQAGDLLVKLA
ncbi:pyruvate carboxylase [Blastopirellula sp. J2-11]|uniref:pyruvate carboxylase n=1 Tax=Blastopirellula sp. J2-11 TaxID=2943192 RepID=UPI0021C7F0EA|nr:pyruvate carboxylase [Blastopirellula sp. J2-11]UUO04774.1 pyruvate carboxylase [Blastopirellula sp. J2-11]